MTAVPTPEPRETSGVTTAGLLAYLEANGGPQAVEEVLRRAEVPYTRAELSDQSRWWSYATRIRLFQAATDVMGDPQTMFAVGAAGLRSGVAHSLVLVLRAMGTPRQVFRQLPRTVAKFSSVSAMEILDSSGTSATVAMTLAPGYPHSHLDCQFARGLTTTVPTIFGLPPARVVSSDCATGSDRTCVFRISWERRSRLSRRQRDRGAAEAEVTALRGQLQTLQSAAGDLVASDDLDTVLHRIVRRAAEAVLAPGYLLAVTDPAGGPPLVHSAGLPEDRIPWLVETLLSGGDLGPGAVVVDIASARRWHGRLAAVYAHGDGGLGDDQPMLAAYAGHAAAALDMLMALEASRREAERAGALLALAHELAGASEAPAICTIVADALPDVVGCDVAGMLLWHPAEGCLRAVAEHGLDAHRRQMLLSASLRAEDIPELVGMLSDREPRFLSATTSSPALQELLGTLGVADVVAVPLLAGRAFLGVATAGWAPGRAPALGDGEALARLRGVGDQASTALQKARLLEQVRHQATHDSLTGLPNRALFLEQLERALSRVGAEQHVGVLFCDLDRFKAVNDSLGHAAGDELLRQVAARLRSAVRPGDTVGRLSGDEFAVILPGLTAPRDTESVVERVAGCFLEPFRLDGLPVPVRTSVGVAVHTGEWGRADQLLREADAAMYRHKQGGRPSGASEDAATS